MAYNFAFYKSYANKWLALGADDRKGEVWYSYDGINFYPLVARHVREVIYLEDIRGFGPISWAGNLKEETLADGAEVLRLSTNRDDGKLVFRPAKPETALSFNECPKFREIHQVCQIPQTGEVVVVTDVNVPHRTDRAEETMNLYVGMVGGLFVRHRTLKYSRETMTVTTDLGILEPMKLAGGPCPGPFWEGYPVVRLLASDYIYAEDDKGMTLVKK